MAEEKKDKKPPAAPSGSLDRRTTEHIIGLLALFLILGAVATALLNRLQNFSLGADASFLSQIIDFLRYSFWPVWKFVAILLSIGSAIGIGYNLMKLNAINIEEDRIFDPMGVVTSDDEDIEEPKNKRWENVVRLSNSNNSSDWRQAIIEADVMLEEMLKAQGYVGDSVGEMLKSVNKNDFNTIEDAWQAHKVRNAVAHSGGTYELNEKETKHTISLFEKVFLEFDII